MVRPLLTVAVAAFCFATPLLAQSPPSGSATSAPTSAKQSDAARLPLHGKQYRHVCLSAKNQQSSDQQLKDEKRGCFASSKQQSGIDPQAPATRCQRPRSKKKAEQQAAADNAQQAKGGRVKGAAKGAAGGCGYRSLVADDEAGKGAAAGATAGTMVGGAPKQKKSQQSIQAASGTGHCATATAAGSAIYRPHIKQGIDKFKRAFSACMEARAYSIK